MRTSARRVVLKRVNLDTAPACGPIFSSRGPWPEALRRPARYEVRTSTSGATGNEGMRSRMHNPAVPCE